MGECRNVAPGEPTWTRGYRFSFCEDRHDRAEVAVTQQASLDDNILNCWQRLLTTHYSSYLHEIRYKPTIRVVMRAFFSFTGLFLSRAKKQVATLDGCISSWFPTSLNSIWKYSYTIMDYLSPIGLPSNNRLRAFRGYARSVP